MALKTSGFGGTELHPFFKPRDYLSAFALAIEPISVRMREDDAGVEQPYVDAKITVFQTSAQLNTGDPALSGMFTLGGNALARSVAEDAGTGDVSFGHLVEVPTKKGNKAMVLRDFSDPAVVEAAVAWYDKAAAEADDEFASMIGD